MKKNEFREKIENFICTFQYFICDIASHGRKIKYQDGLATSGIALF